MLNQTQGFTHAGVERLNDSIRTYAWAILGAQDANSRLWSCFHRTKAIYDKDKNCNNSGGRDTSY